MSQKKCHQCIGVKNQIHKFNHIKTVGTMCRDGVTMGIWNCSGLAIGTKTLFGKTTNAAFSPAFIGTTDMKVQCTTSKKYICYALVLCLPHITGSLTDCSVAFWAFCPFRCADVVLLARISFAICYCVCNLSLSVCTLLVNITVTCHLAHILIKTWKVRLI